MKETGQSELWLEIVTHSSGVCVAGHRRLTSPVEAAYNWTPPPPP